MADRRVLRRLRRALTGRDNANYRGGKIVNKGYVMLLRPGHHRAVKFGSSEYVPRCVVVAERKLGRKLKKSEIVHHKDRNKRNDHPSNLKVVDKRKHVSEHMSGKSNEERKRGV